MVAFNRAISAPVTPSGEEKLLASIHLMTAAEALSDVALSEASIHVLLTLRESDYAIVNELINRFDEYAGIKRDEETGEIL